MCGTACKPLATGALIGFRPQIDHHHAAIHIMNQKSWTVAETKARLSEVIERARSMGPQTITRHGRSVAVVVSPQEWERRTRHTGNLAAFFAASPLRGSGLQLRRKKDGARKLMW